MHFDDTDDGKHKILIKTKHNLMLRGGYYQIDNQIQSFKSFIHLIDNNEMFKELTNAVPSK